MQISKIYLFFLSFLENQDTDVLVFLYLETTSPSCRGTLFVLDFKALACNVLSSFLKLWLISHVTFIFSYPVDKRLERAEDVTSSRHIYI